MRLFKNHTFFETFISIFFGGFLVFLDSIYLLGLTNTEEFTTRQNFLVALVNTIILFICFLPTINYWLQEKLSNKTIKYFLDVPTQESQIKFSDITAFLGAQGLGLTFATILIVFGDFAVQNLNIFLAGAGVGILFIFTIFLTGISLVRFVAFFTRYHSLVYLFASIISTSTSFIAFHLGILLAPDLF